MQAMIEFVNSNGVITKQQYKHCLIYKGKHLFLLLEIAFHQSPCMYFENIFMTGRSLNFVCVGIFKKPSLLSL